MLKINKIINFTNFVMLITKGKHVFIFQGAIITGNITIWFSWCQLLGRLYRPDCSWADKQRPGADIESIIKKNNVIWKTIFIRNINCLFYVTGFIVASIRDMYVFQFTYLFFRYWCIKVRTFVIPEWNVQFLVDSLKLVCKYIQGR